MIFPPSRRWKWLFDERENKGTRVVLTVDFKPTGRTAQLLLEHFASQQIRPVL